MHLRKSRGQCCDDLIAIAVMTLAIAIGIAEVEGRRYQHSRGVLPGQRCELPGAVAEVPLAHHVAGVSEGQPQGKGAVLETKHNGNTRQTQCRMAKRSGNTRQKAVSLAKRSRNARQRQCRMWPLGVETQGKGSDACGPWEHPSAASRCGSMVKFSERSPPVPLSTGSSAAVEWSRKGSGKAVGDASRRAVRDSVKGQHKDSERAQPSAMASTHSSSKDTHRTRQRCSWVVHTQ